MRLLSRLLSRGGAAAAAAVRVHEEGGGTFVLCEPAGGGDQLGAGGGLPDGKLQPADPRLHRQRQGPARRDSHAALGLWAAVFTPPLYIALVILHAKQAGGHE